MNDTQTQEETPITERVPHLTWSHATVEHVIALANDKGWIARATVAEVADDLITDALFEEQNLIEHRREAALLAIRLMNAYGLLPDLDGTSEASAS